MENGRLREKLLLAGDIAKDYTFEKEIRKASGHNELLCPDKECLNPVLRYCHGEKKDAYFAHLNNMNCDYAVFDRENNQITKNIRKKLGEHFLQLGYQVRPEVKLLEHHYTHLLIEDERGSRVAVEIGFHQLSANKIERLVNEYNKISLPVRWIVIDNPGSIVNEKHTYFLKRYLLNESENRDLLVISFDGSQLAQYKADTNRYRYEGEEVLLNADETYYEQSSLEELRLNDWNLTIRGFHERFHIWQTKKQAMFQNKINEIEEYRQAEKDKKENEYYERQDRLENQSRAYLAGYRSGGKSNLSPAAPIPTTGSNTMQIDDIIRKMVDQQVVKACDSQGRRIVKCEICGCIDTDKNFVDYGGINHINLGICKNCNRLARSSE